MHIEIKVVRNEHERNDYIKLLSSRLVEGQLRKGTLTVVLTTELFSKIFSPRRMEMLMEIEEKRTGTVSDLAHKLKRPFEVVHKDLRLFEQFGFVKLYKEKRSVFPTLVGEIHMPIISSRRAVSA